MWFISLLFLIQMIHSKLNIIHLRIILICGLFFYYVVCYVYTSLKTPLSNRLIHIYIIRLGLCYHFNTCFVFLWHLLDLISCIKIDQFLSNIPDWFHLTTDSWHIYSICTCLFILLLFVYTLLNKCNCFIQLQSG
jgi:hypothetical protein